MRITIQEIADFAGVSKTTVSRVINNKPDVDPVTREKILNIMGEHDYYPNIFARGISTQRINHIGLIIPYTVEYIFSNQFYVDVLWGVSNEVEKRGFFLLICYVHESNYVEIYNQKRVEGFVLMSPGSLHHSIIKELQDANIPFISTAKLINEPELVYVDVDNINGAKMGIEHLFSLGHKKIAFVGKPGLTSSYDRLIGYKQALIEKGVGINTDYIQVTESSSIQSGYDAMMKFLRMKEIPTGIFLANDIMAMGAIKAVQESGKRVPQDISIVGFDDILLSQFTNPALTSIKQPAREKGSIATRLLLDYLEKGIKPKTHILNLELVIRESTGPVKKEI